MGIEDLTQLEIAQGTLSLIYAIVGVLIGSLIVIKYFKYKRIELLGVGISISLACVPWFSSGISFLTFIFFGFTLPPALYFFINYGFVAFAILFYVHALTSLLYPESVKKIVLIYLILGIAFEVILIYLLFTNISMVGTMSGRFDSEAGSIPTLFVIFVLASLLVFTIVFIRSCFKSENEKVRWRGRFLLISTILMVVGSLMDTVLTITITTLFIARIFLVTRLIFAYLGWLLPDKVAKWLIKENQ